MSLIAERFSDLSSSVTKPCTVSS